MARSSNKRKRIIDRITDSYLRRIKRWMYCPACNTGKMEFVKTNSLWVCEDCGYSLSAKEFEDDYIFFWCDECGSYLNIQEGFDRHSSKHICQNCGYTNDTTLNNVFGICADCGKTLPDPNASLCVNCRHERQRKAKEWLLSTGRIAIDVGMRVIESSQK